MSFISLLLFILVGVGITNIVVNASILSWIRDWLMKHSNFLNGLLSCMLCSGFWIGCFLSFFYPNISIVAGGAIISLLSYTFGIIIAYIDTATDVLTAQIEYVDTEE